MANQKKLLKINKKISISLLLKKVLI